MPKQRHDNVPWKTDAQLGGRFEGTNQPRSLHDPFDDNPPHGARRLAPTDPGKRP